MEACRYDVYINHWLAENPEDLSQEEFHALAEEYERRFAEQPPRKAGIRTSWPRRPGRWQGTGRSALHSFTSRSTRGGCAVLISFTACDPSCSRSKG